MGEFFEALKRGEFVNPHPRTATPPKVRTIDGKRYFSRGSSHRIPKSCPPTLR